MFTSTRFIQSAVPSLRLLKSPSSPAVPVAGHGAPAPQRARSPVSPATANPTVIGPAFVAPMVIVDEAMLQPADLHGARTGTLGEDSWAQLRPPQPGIGGTYPSTALRRCERAVSAVLGLDQGPTVVVEYVAVYRSDGAHRYLQDLREALAACRGDDGQGGRWTILSAGLAGRESLRLRLRESFEYAGETITKDTYLAASATGRVLVVVFDAGWETGDGHRDLVDELITPAVRRAGILR